MHHTLREAAKVIIGLFIADLVGGILLGAAGFFPLTVLGVTWTSDSILPFVIFDAAVILLLAHYAWNTRSPIRSTSERTLLLIAGFIFLILALVHLLRIAFGWDVILGTYDVPLWLSWIGIFVAGFLSYSSFHFAFRSRG